MATTTTQVTGGKKKAGEAGRRNPIGGFLVAKLNGKLMRDFVRSFGIEKIDTDVTDEQLAVALTQHFRSTVPEEDLVRCENCDGVSSADFDACPFCGDAGGGVEDEDEEGVEAAPIEAADVSFDDEEAAPERDGDRRALAHGEEEDDSADEGDEDDSADEGDDEDEEAPAPAVAKETTTMETHAMNGAPKKKSAAKKPPEAQVAALVPAAQAKGLAKAIGGPVTARDLDRAVADVRKLKMGSVVAYWELGRKILEINAKNLWKLRTDEAGKARYKSFEAFVHHELSMSPAHAYNAMECAQGYATAEAIREIGSTSKASMILKAAPPDRPAIVDKAKAGASKREIAKDVAASRAKHGSPKQSQQAKAGAKSAAAKAAKAPARAEKVSMAVVEGTKMVKLYKRPASMKGLDFASLDFAKKLSEQPFGRRELGNGVVEYYSVLTKETGELVLRIETRREEG